MRYISSVVATAALLVLPAIATAQAPTMSNAHKGFTFSVGLASGSAVPTCSGCSNSRTSGFAGYLSAGMPYSPSITLNAELNGWSHSQTGEDDQMLFLLGTAQFYPTMDGKLFLKGGLGWGQTQIKDTQNNNTLKASGLGYEIGAGYDWQLGQSFAITPFVNYLAHTEGTASVNGSSTGTKIGGNMYQFGAALTWF